MADLNSAFDDTWQLVGAGPCTTTVCTCFVGRVLAGDGSRAELAVTRDVLHVKQRVSCDALVNASPTAYGFARLDAFGRIFNRVLRAVLAKQDFIDVLPDVFEAEELPAIKATLAAVIAPDAPEGEVVERALARL